MTIYDHKESQALELTNYAINFCKYDDHTEVLVWPEPNSYSCFTYITELSPEEVMAKLKLLKSFNLNDDVEVVMK